MMFHLQASRRLAASLCGGFRATREGQTFAGAGTPDGPGRRLLACNTAQPRRCCGDTRPVLGHGRSVMMRTVSRSKALLIAGLLALQAPAAVAQAIAVELRSTEQGWQLLRDGKPYLIMGAGGSGSLAQLAAAGGNSTRTWDADGIGPILDEAQSLGLSVTVGIWLGHERHGFDYGDPAQVKAQFERARAAVLRYKDHPAVLLWAIGNEMEGFETGDNPAIWRAVNDIASMIKELDPAHPTMTVTAEIGGARVASLNRYGRAIDIHGINSYGGAPSLAQRYRDAGGTKPFVLTEFGPPGPWEVATNNWGGVREATSSEKAAFYGQAYTRAIIGNPGLALGSYAFTWGFKMEATATWFGMFLNDGARLAAIDTMQEIWSGKPPANRAPTIAPLKVAGADTVNPDAAVTVTAAIADPEQDPLQIRWVLRPDSDEFVTGGDFRPDLPDIPDAVLESSASSVRLRMPEEPGPYRLFVYAYDDAGNAATANVPLLVKGTRRTRMPVIVYNDSFQHMPWVPSGWMGATEE
ncbi:MAG: glycoside hydrolase family 2 TIM barrel-domain containing protein, partial [Woeseia sp.]